MTPKPCLLLRFAIALVLAIPLTWWNPGGYLPDGLRENLVAEFVGALITLLFVERSLDAVERKHEKERRAELRRATLATLDADLHALWSLMGEPRARDDPIRRAPIESRIVRFLSDLDDAAMWAHAPGAHATAVRGRIRDLGEDADRLLVLSENVAELDSRERYDALRLGCRVVDEAWNATPRGDLAALFRVNVGERARALLRV